MLRFLPSLLLASHACAGAKEPPVIPVGLDAYRMWERWPYERIGARAFMRSTYDRRGGNEGADASHFLYQVAEDRNVTLDIAGPGILYFARYNHWHGSPWHYQVDGTDQIIHETRNAEPDKDVLDLISRSGSDLVPGTNSKEGRKLHLREDSGRSSLAPETTTTLVNLRTNASMLRAMEFSVPREQAIELGRARLRIT